MHCARFILPFFPLTYLMAANTAPETPKEPVVETIHGVKITDNYRWLEDQDSPRTREWLKSQMGYTKSTLDGVPGRARIEKRLGELMKVDAIGIPHEAGGRYFYPRRPKGASQPMLCMRQGLNGKEEVLVDGNKLGKGKSAVMFNIRNDGKMIAFGIRQGGEDELNVKFMDLETRKQLEDDLPRARYYGIEVAQDHKGYYYSTMLKEGPRLYYRAFGETTAKLVELYSSDKISIRDEDWKPIGDAIQYLQQGEYLAKLTTKILETGVSESEADENSILIKLASNSERNERIIEQIKLANESKESTVVFACSLDHV